MKKYIALTIAAVALLLAPIFQATNASAAIGTPGYGFMVQIESSSEYDLTAEEYETNLATFKRDIDLMVEYGQTWARFAVPAWAISYYDNDRNYILKTAAGNPDVDVYTYYQEAIQYMNDAGLNIYMISVGTTAQGSQFTQAEYIENISKHWEFLAENFADDVDVIQIYNEAQGYHYRFYEEVDEADFQSYWEEMSGMFAIARSIFKAENPDVQMTTNSFGWPIWYDVEAEWLAFFDVVGENLDVITLDMYPDTQDQIPRLAEFIKNAKDRYGKPVIVGETGRQGYVDAGNDYSRSIPGQEENVVLYMNAFRESEATAILMYQLRDTGPDQTQGEQNFGILEYDGSRKASFDGIMYSMRPVIVDDPVVDDDTDTTTDDDAAAAGESNATDDEALGAPNTGVISSQPALLSAIAGALSAVLVIGLVLRRVRQETK